MDIMKMIGKYRKLQTEIFSLQKEIEDKKTEVDEILSGNIEVRLDDLLSELATMFRVDRSDINVKIDTGISFFGNYSKDDIKTMFLNFEDYHNLRTNKNILDVNISSLNNGNLFRYLSLECSLNFDAIQADGKPMYDHLDVEKRKFGNGNEYTILVANEGIDDIILQIPFKSLVSVSSYGWHPSFAFMQAVINCSKISSIKNDEYTLSRKK